MPRQVPPEFRQRALRMIEESMPEQEAEYAAIRHVGAKPVSPSHFFDDVSCTLADNRSPCSRAGTRGHAEHAHGRFE